MIFLHAIAVLIFGITTVFSATETKINNDNERKNIMNLNKQKPDTWSTYVNKTKSSGKFVTHDKLGVPVALEWYKTTMASPQWVELMRGVSNLGIQAFTGVEMEFLKTFPEVVGAEPYFKPFEPLFSAGSTCIDWHKVVTVMQSVIKNHFIIDTTKFNKEVLEMFAQDVSLFVMVKNHTGKLLGFINFLVRPGFAYGTVKVTSIAVETEMQNRGLAKLLMSSVFAILPDTQHIFLCTRVTNNTALRAYTSWGFVKDENSIQDPHYTFNLKHWTFMEYSIMQSDVLQKIATMLLD